MNRFQARSAKHFAYPYNALTATTKLSTGQASPVTSTGNVFSQFSLVTNRRFEGALVQIPYSVTNDTGCYVTIAAQLKDSTASGGSFATVSSGTVTIDNTTTASDLATKGVLSFNANLADSNEWLKVNVIVTFESSATGANVVASATIGGAVVTFLGPNRTPASGGGQ